MSILVEDLYPKIIFALTYIRYCFFHEDSPTLLSDIGTRQTLQLCAFSAVAVAPSIFPQWHDDSYDRLSTVILFHEATLAMHFSRE